MRYDGSDSARMPMMPTTVATIAKLAVASSFPTRMARYYAPVGPRRDELDSKEQQDVSQGLKQWLPAMVETDATPIPRMLASPGRQSLLAGLLGAAAGAGLGGQVGGQMGGQGTIGAIAGAAALGVPAALGTYLHRHHKNDSIIESLRRLPPGSTHRDYDAERLLNSSFEEKFGSVSSCGATMSAPHVKVRPHSRRLPQRNKTVGKRADDVEEETAEDREGNPNGNLKPDHDEDSTFSWGKLAAKMDPSYDPKHADECCPSCGARLERGDNGDCNRCGKPWPRDKTAEQRTCSCGTTMRGAWCPNCRTFSKKALFAEAANALLLKQADPVSSGLGEVAEPLMAKAAPVVEETAAKVLPKATTGFFGRLFGSAVAPEAESVAGSVARRAVGRVMPGLAQRGAGAATGAVEGALDRNQNGYRLPGNWWQRSLQGGAWGAAAPAAPVGYGAGLSLDLGRSALSNGTAPDADFRGKGALGGTAFSLGSQLGVPGISNAAGAARDAADPAIVKGMSWPQWGLGKLTQQLTEPGRVLPMAVDATSIGVAGVKGVQQVAQQTAQKAVNTGFDTAFQRIAQFTGGKYDHTAHQNAAGFGWQVQKAAAGDQQAIQFLTANKVGVGADGRFDPGVANAQVSRMALQNIGDTFNLGGLARAGSALVSGVASAATRSAMDQQAQLLGFKDAPDAAKVLQPLLNNPTLQAAGKGDPGALQGVAKDLHTVAGMADQVKGMMSGGAQGMFGGLPAMADKLLGVIPGLDVQNMTGVQKIVTLLSMLGLVGGGIGGLLGGSGSMGVIGVLGGIGLAAGMFGGEGMWGKPAAPATSTEEMSHPTPDARQQYGAGAPSPETDYAPAPGGAAGF